jgi:hypothetical protein
MSVSGATRLAPIYAELAAAGGCRDRPPRDRALLLVRDIRCGACRVALRGFAVIETYEFSDPALEERYHVPEPGAALPESARTRTSRTRMLRSPRTCASLLYRAASRPARVIREILDNMVARYGEFVRYRPDPSTA